MVYICTFEKDLYIKMSPSDCDLFQRCRFSYFSAITIAGVMWLPSEYLSSKVWNQSWSNSVKMIQSLCFTTPTEDNFSIFVNIKILLSTLHYKCKFWCIHHHKMAQVFSLLWVLCQHELFYQQFHLQQLNVVHWSFHITLV